MHALDGTFTSYKINKGVNRPIEFRGLRAQYIYYLAIGLAVLLLLFCILYICGMPVYICLVLILALGALLFTGVARLNRRYGRYGLMKRSARRRLPGALRPRSFMFFRGMNTNN